MFLCKKAFFFKYEKAAYSSSYIYVQHLVYSVTIS